MNRNLLQTFRNFKPAYLHYPNIPILAKKDHLTTSFCHSSLNISLAWTILQKLILYHKTCALSSARPRSHDWGCFLLPQQGYTATSSSSSLQFTITEFTFEIKIDNFLHLIGKSQIKKVILLFAKIRLEKTDTWIGCNLSEEEWRCQNLV